MLENIVEPLLAGVYGGDSGALSMSSVLPRFAEMERKYGSIIRGALEEKWSRNKAAKGSKATPPLFMTVKEGLSELIQALGKRLEPSRLHLGQRVTGIERVTSNWKNPYRIRCEGNTSYDADVIVLALPAHRCAEFLTTLSPELAESFNAIPYSSAATVTLGLEAAAVKSLPRGFGFLVPKKEDPRLLACTFVHKKFPDRVPEGKAMLRCFLGGSRNPEVLKFSDEEILKSVWRELCSILTLHNEPFFWRISRWPSAMAQYTVGHQKRVERILRQIEKFPRVYLAGNAYSGIGLSDCIRTGRNAAKRALEM
jgi:protoporphyrinogen/coproporphyrinogen III oxidase